MSRIGRNPITVPSGVTVTVAYPTINVKGPKGDMTRTLPTGIAVSQEENILTVSRADDEPMEVRHRVALCRCGDSANKPLCDGSHLSNGFEA